MILAFDDNGPGPVVVLLHGFPLDRTMWAAQAATLGSLYRVITPDLRGFGQTAAPGGIYPIEDMADDVVETLDALKIAEPIVLGGLSMGGYVAMSLAVRYPKRLRALMLMDTRAGADSPEAAAHREATAREVEATGRVEGVVASYLPKLFGPVTRERRADLVAQVAETMRATSPLAVAGALRGMATRADRSVDLGRITVPTLVMVGADDALTPPAEARAIAAKLPHAQLVEVPDAGHLAPLEDPAAANAAILKFLESLA
jgi:pimeloyl-ACP methyl ester carboxylesterase